MQRGPVVLQRAANCSKEVRWSFGAVEYTSNVLDLVFAISLDKESPSRGLSVRKGQKDDKSTIAQSRAQSQAAGQLIRKKKSEQSLSRTSQRLAAMVSNQSSFVKSIFFDR